MPRPRLNGGGPGNDFGDTMHIDKYRTPEGIFKCPNGDRCDHPELFLSLYVLGLSGYGTALECLRYVRDVLNHYRVLMDVVWDGKMSREEWEESGRKLFPSVGAEYFARQLTDDKELTVQGCITNKGRELLEDLNEVLAKNEDNTND